MGSLTLILANLDWIIGGGFLLLLVILIRRYYQLKSQNKEKDEIIFGHEVKDKVWKKIVESNKQLEKEKKEIDNADKETLLDMLNSRHSGSKR